MKQQINSRNKQVSCFMKQSEKRELQKMAEQDQRTLSDFVRLKLLEVLDEQRVK